jgi:hypothetical protein
MWLKKKSDPAAELLSMAERAVALADSSNEMVRELHAMVRMLEAEKACLQAELRLQRINSLLPWPDGESKRVH